MDESKGREPMSERVAICRSSADIPMESVELCLHVDAPAGGWSGEPFRPLDYPFWMTRSDAKPKWNNGEFNIFAFVPGYAPKVEPSPVVAEKPIDWTRFLSADFVGEDINCDGDGYRLAAGTVFLSGDINQRSVRKMVDPSRRVNGTTIALAGPRAWSSHNCRVIRHPDGTWAPGYGPNGPVETAPSVATIEDAREVQAVSLERIKAVEDHLIQHWMRATTVLMPPLFVGSARGVSLVAAIPDLPRDHHAPLKHLVPRWRTPRYEAPGRWRK